MVLGLRKHLKRPSVGGLRFGGLRCFDGQAGTVWRFFVEWRGADASPQVQVLDLKGCRLDIEVFPFEEQELEGQWHRRYLSVCLPAGRDSFALSAFDPQGALSPGAIHVDSAAFVRHQQDTRRIMGDAWGDAERYRQWLRGHQAGKAKLWAQRRKRLPLMPPIGIILVADEGQGEDEKGRQGFAESLAASRASVEAQSYQGWELFVAHGDQGLMAEIERLTKEAQVDSYAAFLRAGDVLEPDALYSFVSWINSCPDAALLYCDEDGVTDEGSYEKPLFKTGFNQDLLYSYPYMGDFLMVKGGLLESWVKAGRMAEAATFLGLHPVATYDMKAPKGLRDADAVKDSPCLQDQTQHQGTQACPGGFATNDLLDVFTYDLALNAVETKARIASVPRVLAHNRIRPGQATACACPALCRNEAWQHDGTGSQGKEGKAPLAYEAGRQLLAAHLSRQGIAACVQAGEQGGYRVRYSLPDPCPEVAIIIPSKDHVDVLDSCIRSLIERAGYSAFRIYVVENNSEDEATFRYYASIQEEFTQVKVLYWEGPFNYSAIINFGARATESPYLLFLNNDTEVISPNFIEEMLGCLQRGDVGVVGAKLFFRDRLVQHAGIMVASQGALAHANQDFTPKRPGYLGRAAFPGSFTAVTGACQMVRRSVFNELGGYNEQLAVGFNDADFCLKAWQAGYQVVFTPYAELYHYEFVSRGREAADPQKQARWRKERALFQRTWAGFLKGGDPFSNPNLDRDNRYYALPPAWPRRMGGRVKAAIRAFLR
ncbi:MAG: glycosyltransferase family 2 protein [Coriobacteriaceae bacterium]|jgi:GT2 family glycosyltransferase|nr:glycosyltransferase family 2 protein [Coriobacteriaceae bacterium]